MLKAHLQNKGQAQDEKEVMPLRLSSRVDHSSEMSEMTTQTLVL